MPPPGAGQTPGRGRARAVGQAGLLIPALGVIAFLAVLGVATDIHDQTSALWLFVALHVASACGIGLAAWLARKVLGTPRRRWLFVLLALVGWRVSYFPFMVFAGTFASYVEALQVLVTGRSLWIWPSFLVGFAGLHAGVALACALPFGRYRLWALVAVPFLLQALMISFTASEDLRLLPDHTWRLHSALPEVSLPQANPYLPALETADLNLWQKLLPFAAGSTYDLIPGSPWARVVQGVLEAEFRRNPRGSSSLRVEEHYVGYLLAHPFIGTRPDGK